MKRDLTRREFHFALGMGAAAIAATEMGGLRPAWAAERFVIASTGGSYGEGIADAFVKAPKFEEKHGISVAYSHQLESVAVAKIIAQCGNPPFAVSAHGEAEAILLADGGCLQGYDLDLIPNYKDIVPTGKLASRAGMDAFWASFQLVVFALTWNTKEASTPTSFKDLWNPKYKGRVAVPAYGWYGMWWLHALNKTLGGDEDNISPAMEAVAELVKKNDAIIIENVDHGMKVLTREEAVIMPFWNGRTYSLQANGVPVQIAFVPGSIQLGSGFVITKGTAFSELANRFVNNSLDGNFQMEMTKRFRYPPSNGTAKLPAEMAHYKVPESELKNMVPLNFEKVNAHRSEYLDRWNKEVIG
jgi:putative spermidine/putrescine transport system substrate-binding protein